MGIALRYLLLTRSCWDKLWGTQKVVWAAAICSPNDEWDSGLGHTLAEQRLCRALRGDYIEGRAGRITVPVGTSTTEMMSRIVDQVDKYRRTRNKA
jgi:hypothetical protein